MDFSRLRNLYNFEEIKVEEIKRYGRKPVYKVITEKGSFFLKTYNNLNNNIIEGLKLLDYLISKNYPALKVIKSKNNNYVEILDNIPIALFEWIDTKKYEVPNPTLEHSRNLGKALALLHKLTENYDFPENEKWGLHLDNIEMSLYRYKKFINRKAPEKLKEIYYEIFEELEKLEVPENLPKAITHGEFTYEHVLFKDTEVYKVIDWDPVNRTYMFLDMGLSMTFILLDIGKEEHVKAFLEGYSEIRTLTKWEKENLDKIYLTGAATYLWWILSDIKNKVFSWEDVSYKALEFWKDIKKWI